MDPLPQYVDARDLTALNAQLKKLYEHVAAMQAESKVPVARVAYNKNDPHRPAPVLQDWRPEEDEFFTFPAKPIKPLYLEVFEYIRETLVNCGDGCQLSMLDEHVQKKFGDSFTFALINYTSLEHFVREHPAFKMYVGPGYVSYVKLAQF